MRKFAIGIVGCIAVLAWIGVAYAAPTFIGSEKCKMCHKTEFESWAASKHAKAFETLKPEDRAKPECLKCHAVGGNAAMPGVGCESCHGAGSEYKAMNVMKDKAAAAKAGLLVPDEKSCRSCHEGAPHKQAPFDYEKAKATGLHAKKAKA